MDFNTTVRESNWIKLTKMDFNATVRESDWIKITKTDCKAAVLLYNGHINIRNIIKTKKN